MNFREKLLLYMESLGINQQEISKASRLGHSTIGRYCSGERAPKPDSREIILLSEGIASLASERGEDITANEILAALQETVDSGLSVDYDIFISNLKFLLKRLDIRTAELSRALNYDASYVSKVISGSRKPGNIRNFAQRIADYVALRFTGSARVYDIASITGVEEEDIATTQALRESVLHWLGSHSENIRDETVSDFLQQMDTFNLYDYMKSIHFDEIKIPPAMPHLPTRREYLGIGNMKESEIDFIKTTVLSKSSESCILYSDMPLEEMASDAEFARKYLFGMAMLLKKNLHLHIIHDVNRPLAEMMLGLTSYIPMYMTGQISPWYLPRTQSEFFMHLLKVSGSCALEGSAISGRQSEGKYVLYRSREEIKHYRTRAEALLAKASPLMDIYNEERRDEYISLINSLPTDIDVKMICSNLPVFLIPDGIQDEILSSVCAEDAAVILTYHSLASKKLKNLLNEGHLHIVLPGLSQEEYEDRPVGLATADLFLHNRIELSYDAYRRFTHAILEAAEAGKNMTAEINPSPDLHNINISIIGEKMIIVSKEKSPAIHFVIRHKKMIRAFRNFIPSSVRK